VPLTVTEFLNCLVRWIENRLTGAEVLLQRFVRERRERLVQFVGDVGDVRAAPFVDRLIVVPDDEQILVGNE